MSKTVCIKATVKGKVQGVWYRKSTKDISIDLQVKGYAKNLKNGDVEVLLCGAEDSVEKIKEWLHEGPPLSRVDKVEIEELPYQEVEGFRTL